MVAVKNILLFVSVTTALTILKRDTSTILNDISTIYSNVKSLTSSQGTSDAQATSQLSSADSKSIVAAIQNLTPDIQTSLQAVQSKKSQFAAAGLTSTVQNDLASLKADADAFANALIAIASADTKDQANSDAATVDSYFQPAINAFN